MAISDIKTGFDEGSKKIVEALAKRQEKRNTETVRDSIVAKMAQAGAKPETLEIIGKLSSDSPTKLVNAISDIQNILKNTPVGQEEELQKKIKESYATTIASEQAKLDPGLVSGKLNVRGQEKEQDLQFKAQEQFLDVQKQILQKGVDLDATEKQKLVFAQQGAKTVEQAQNLLNDQNFIGAVFQQAGGSIGKLSTAGNTQLRNYNTAIGSSIFSFVFANSGAQVSDKERKAFENIYGLQVGDTLENGKYKAALLADFFKTAKDVIDPNKVAGLSVAELKGRMNEIQQQIKALGKGNSEDAKIIMKTLQEKALGVGDSNETLSRLGIDPNKFELVEE